MNERLQTGNGDYGQAIGGGMAVDRQRVLRNTYWLLALSMVPTVLGAWIGVSTGILATMGFGMSTMLFFVGAFGLMFLVEKTKNSSAGVYALLGFTFFMGLMLSRLLAQILGFKNGGSLIMMAFGGTGAIFFAMATMATVIKRDLSAVRGRGHLDGGRHREHFPAVIGLDVDHDGAGDGGVFGLHAVRHQARD